MKLFPTIITATIALGSILLTASNAYASLYRSGNASTTLRIVERNVQSDNHIGSYTTIIAGQTWNGSFKATGEGMPGSYLYKATFEDSPINNAKVKCTGTLEMVRKPLSRAAGMSMTMTWNVTGGTQCPAIGKKFQVTLTEAIPTPNAKGDYTENWGLWTVVSTDGKLNCRVKPNGKVLHTFQAGDQIFLDGRLGDTMQRVNGDTWMYVPHLGYPYTDANYKPCFVRANSKYIRPLSIGF